MKNDSMAEDNIDELVSPVISVKNDSAGSKPDKISTIKLRSMSNGNKVLPYYRSSSSTSSYNAGNIRRRSTGKLNVADSRQVVIPHYLRASTSSCHDFCKYGRKYSSEAKPWHPLSKRKNKLCADEQSPARTLVGEAKKGTLVKQKLSTSPGSVLGEKKKVKGVEQKPSTGSCHDFYKYGRKYSSKEKPWHRLLKRKNKLIADEQSPTRTLVGEAKKGTWSSKTFPLLLGVC
ncbi:hypothetical protein CQW23_30763 [Capsicum baccatum]|uniref:Calmodulin-binding domain-containing protein n=1 Tax=Capsicum baccatum TaxID=33114 RepID=A0A2G2V9I6_CAPBA|nr:hypothetical protein CQW23_30763 [Capsicum baccatum]